MNEPLDTPLKTYGFSFVEYAAPEPEHLRQLFEKMGFPTVARHKQRDITLHVQGDITFVINAETEGFSNDFAQSHGPCACAMGFRVADAADARERACRHGARLIEGPDRVLDMPAIEGIGGSRLYLVEEDLSRKAWATDYIWLEDAGVRQTEWGAGLIAIDHLTHNVYWGNMDRWRDFYERLFGFREIRRFDIKGKKTGLISRALASPDGKIRIPLNESEDEKSQINEYLEQYNGEGIQHIALAADDIYTTVDKLRANGIEFQDTPDAYYEKIDTRLPGHSEPVDELRKRRILIDGGEDQGGGLLLQIFTTNVIGPIFYEIIQRKGNEGFGEGNFQALFESIEEDQIRRGYLEAEEPVE